MARTFLPNGADIKSKSTISELAEDGSSVIKLAADAPMNAGSFEGNATISPTATGCSINLVATMNVSVPMIGATIEQKALNHLENSFADQCAFIDQWITDHK